MLLEKGKNDKWRNKIYKYKFYVVNHFKDKKEKGIHLKGKNRL